jgi:hypothetical protein
MNKSVVPNRLSIQIIPLLHFTASVADPDPGSGAFLTTASGSRNRFFQEPGSRIPGPGSQTHIFESLVIIFWEKRYIIL